MIEWFIIIIAALFVLLMIKKKPIKDPFEAKAMVTEIEFSKERRTRPFEKGDYVGKKITVKKQEGIIVKIYFEGSDEEEEFEKKYQKWS